MWWKAVQNLTLTLGTKMKNWFQKDSRKFGLFRKSSLMTEAPTNVRPLTLLVPENHSHVKSKSDVSFTAPCTVCLSKLIIEEISDSIHWLYHHRKHAKSNFFIPDRPRKTDISIRDSQVRVDTSLYFTCETDAYPAPESYSWYRYSTNKRFEASRWQSLTTGNNMLNLKSVQRTDEACYTCNATNDVGTGWSSGEKCITVLCK